MTEMLKVALEELSKVGATKEDIKIILEKSIAKNFCLEKVETEYIKEKEAEGFKFLIHENETSTSYEGREYIHIFRHCNDVRIKNCRVVVIYGSAFSVVDNCKVFMTLDSNVDVLSNSIMNTVIDSECYKVSGSSVNRMIDSKVFKSDGGNFVKTLVR